MTPPSSPWARQLLQMRDCTTELRWEYNYFSVLICFVWSTAAEGWDLSFLWRGPQRTLGGRSFCCSATIRARHCPLALLWSPVQIWWPDCRRSAVGVRFFSLAIEVFDQEKTSRLKSFFQVGFVGFCFFFLLLHFQSTQWWHHFFLYLIPVLETRVPSFIPSRRLSGTVRSPLPCEEQDNLDCKVMNGDIWPSLLLYTLSPTLLLQTDDGDKVGKLFKVLLECEHSSLGTRNLACLKQKLSSAKLSFVRTWSKSCWKQEPLCWACRLITPLFH